jgi:hypothetical protein
MHSLREVLTAVTVVLALLGGLILCRGAGGQDTSNFELGFDAPAEVRGKAGETVTFEAFATLTGPGDLSAHKNCWTLSMTASGGTITGISIEGLPVMVALDRVPPNCRSSKVGSRA